MKPTVTVAKAIRLEREESSDTLYIVFEITNLAFQQQVIKDFGKDVPLQLIGTNLVRNET